MANPKKQDKEREINQLVQKLYLKEKNKQIDLEDFTEAIAIIKQQRRSIVALQGWNNKYRLEITHLKKENLTLEQLKQQVAVQKQVIQQLAQDKTQLNQQMQQTIEELEEYENKILKVQWAYDRASEVNGTLNLWDRLNVLLLALKELFAPTSLNNNHQEDERYWMKTDPASIGKALLDD